MSNFFNSGGASFSSLRDDWETPHNLFTELNNQFGFTLDPCSTHENAKCHKHYTKDENGLVQDWKNETVFVNPPYGRDIAKWVEKCFNESKHAKIVMLIPARTDTKWFHDYIYHKSEITFIKGRLKYEINGMPGNSAPFPSMIVEYPDYDDWS